MASVKDVATLSSLVLETAAKIQQLGNNWYKESADWKAFPLKVSRLRRKHKLWEDKLTQLGMLSDEALKQSLNEAQELLEKEMKVLERRDSSSSFCAPRCWPMFSGTMFPDKIGLSIQGVIESFDEILGLLKLEDDATSLLEKKALRRPISLPVRIDNRYVPLRDSERELYKALHNPEGPAVVLLHGGPGKGKSTLARQMGLHFNEDANRAMFDNIFLLECGPQATTFQKQFELFQMLGGQITQDSNSGSEFAIRKRLVDLLKDQKILIIIDDVFCDLGFELQGIVDLCGIRVKCLVTSQLASLCRDIPGSLSILIQDIGVDDARKILASHVGLPDLHIPDHLQEIADKMIEATEANPLALASLATALSFKHSTNSREWEAALGSLSTLLAFEGTARIHGMKYPRSFLATVKLCVEGLKGQWDFAQTLLILTAICEGPSIPEVVIQILAAKLDLEFLGKPGIFYRSRNELEARELLRTRNDSPDKIIWSMHSLQKQYIMAEMSEAIDGVLALFAKDSQLKPQPEIVCVQELEDTMVMTLCALYFDKAFSDRVAPKVPIPFEKRSLRRSAIEPIVWLLGRRVNPPQWTETVQHSARKVFISYVCNGILDDDGGSQLLNFPVSAAATLTAFSDVSLVDVSVPLLHENKAGLMKTVVTILGDTRDTSKQQEAILMLGSLAINVHHHAFITFFDGILEAVIALLFQFPRAAARALANLASGGKAETVIKVRIAECPGAIAGLVKILSNDRLHSDAASLVLGNLSAGASEEVKIKIAKFPGALSGLVDLLAKDDHNARHHAARTLANLSSMESDEILINIAEFPGAIAGLVSLLSMDNDDLVHTAAARALGYLVGYLARVDSNKIKMGIAGLVELLSKDRSVLDHENAAWALANLASTNSDEMRMDIAIGVNNPITLIGKCSKHLL